MLLLLFKWMAYSLDKIYVVFKDASGMIAELHHDTLGSSRISWLSEICWLHLEQFERVHFQIKWAETSKQCHTRLVSQFFMKYGLFLNLIWPSTNTSVISSSLKVFS